MKNMVILHCSDYHVGGDESLLIIIVNIIVGWFNTSLCTEKYHDRDWNEENGIDNKDDYDGKNDDDEYNAIHNKDDGDGDGDDEEDDALTTAQVTSIDRHWDNQGQGHQDNMCTSDCYLSDKMRKLASWNISVSA